MWNFDLCRNFKDAAKMLTVVVTSILLQHAISEEFDDLQKCKLKHLTRHHSLADDKLVIFFLFFSANRI